MAIPIYTEAKLAYLSETKDLIKTALIAKGQTVTDEDTFRSYAGKILNIGEAGQGVTASGSFVATAPSQTIEHGLGVLPDIIYVWANKMPEAGNGIFMTCGFSEAMTASVVEGSTLGKQSIWSTWGSVFSVTVDKSMKDYSTEYADSGATYGFPRNPTAFTFDVGGGTMGILQTDMTYNWTAIGGVF